MEFLNGYITPVILTACLLAGFIIKKWVKDVDNKWIPTVVTVLGAVLAVLMNLGNVTLETVVGGALSGLASTGMHQLFKQWLEKGEEN